MILSFAMLEMLVGHFLSSCSQFGSEVCVLIPDVAPRGSCSQSEENKPVTAPHYDGDEVLPSEVQQFAGLH